MGDVRPQRPVLQQVQILRLKLYLNFLGNKCVHPDPVPQELLRVKNQPVLYVNNNVQLDEVGLEPEELKVFLYVGPKNQLC